MPYPERAPGGDMDDGGVSQLYFDDFHIGARFRSPARTIGEAHYLFFAGMTGDNSPLHYDEEFARRTRFGGRVAHGLLVMAMTALGASPLSARLDAAMVAFAGQDGRFRKPVLIGDTIHTVFEVESLERKGEVGLLRFAVTVVNQRDETVLEGHHVYLVRCR